MQDLQIIETEMLVNRLASLALEYSRMRIEGGSDKDFARCNLAIMALQREIYSRQQPKGRIYPSTIGPDRTNGPDRTKPGRTK